MPLIAQSRTIQNNKKGRCAFDSAGALVWLEFVEGLVLLRPLKGVGQQLGHAVVELRGVARHLKHVRGKVVVEGHKGVEDLLTAVGLGQGLVYVDNVQEEVQRMHHVLEHLQVPVH